MKQPDFTRIFFDYFGGKPKKIRYELRIPPHFLHDLVFLSSIIHDALFFRKDVVLRKQKLTIPLNRDCWELPLTTEKNELHVARAKLVFTTVQDLKWVFEDGLDPNEELSIDGLCINESYRSHSFDRFDFMILGHGWQLRFTLARYEFTAVLQDLELPYLWSKRKK